MCDYELWTMNWTINYELWCIHMVKGLLASLILVEITLCDEIILIRCKNDKNEYIVMCKVCDTRILNSDIYWTVYILNYDTRILNYDVS